jgi:diguanylate cyclase (GGDEF)-like protein
MQASSLTSRLRRGLVIRDWAWWQTTPKLRCYVGFIIGLAIAVTVVLAVHTEWRVSDAVKFLVLACCGTISMASTPRIMYTNAGATRDFGSTWVLPTAILLPPVYAAVIAVPIIATVQFYVNPGVLYRRAFSAAALSLSYATISLCFRLIPASFAGELNGLGAHAFTWCLAVGACEIIGCRIQHFLIVAAVKMANPSMRMFSGEFDRDALQGLFVEIDLAILITLAVAVSPALVVIALPTVLLVRRFLVHPILVAQSRVDAKTGLLNVSAWEAEAETEVSRAVRLHAPLAVALVDIDHFKNVNDTYGHLVGDRVLRAIAEGLTGQLRDYDRAGRFGGEEFVLLLAQTGERDACAIAQRLRAFIEDLAIPVDDHPDAPTLSVTISIGVTALSRGQSFELTDLLAAADSAMYHVKQAGRNQVAFAAPLRDMGLNAAWDAAGDEAASRRGGGPGSDQAVGSTQLSGHRVELVRSEHTAASLCPRMSLSVLDRALHEAARARKTAYARAASNRRAGRRMRRNAIDLKSASALA